jgi:ferritin-like metal-binding protein YciE
VSVIILYCDQFGCQCPNELPLYGTLIAWADELGRDDIVRLLTTTLNEEKAADKKLHRCPAKGVNRKAAS